MAKLKSTEAAPLFTVRVRRSDRGRRYHVIKVTHHGPHAKRWVPYSKWLWEQTNGPLPEDLIVVHLDGNPLNDDVANLRAMTRADRNRHIFHLRPHLKEKLRRRILKMNAKIPAEKTRIRRMTSWLMHCFYLVDLRQRVIYRDPERHLTKLLAGYGLVVTRNEVLKWGRHLLQETGYAAITGREAQEFPWSTMRVVGPARDQVRIRRDGQTALQKLVSREHPRTDYHMRKDDD